MGLSSPAARRRLEAFIAAEAAAEGVRIVDLERLAGGAIQENWALEVELTGGPLAGRATLVLRRNAESTIAESHGRVEEFRLLRVAYRAGVLVPEPLWCSADTALIGSEFYLMRRVAGTAAGHRIVRDEALGGPRPALAERLGAELARIHAVRPEMAAAESLDFLAPAEADRPADRVARFRAYLDRHPVPHPALEWGLRWLEREVPDAVPPVLVHRDFRTGNYMVDATGLTAILDWEFAGWGDPMEDIGWFCARCWRFGADGREAGGIADRAPFYRGYARESGREIDPDRVRYWEVMAHVRWAVTAILQGERHVSGREPSLELALTGRRPAELGLEVLRLTAAVPA